jgi:hypothetical protein
MARDGAPAPAGAREARGNFNRSVKRDGLDRRDEAIDQCRGRRIGSGQAPRISTKSGGHSSTGSKITRLPSLRWEDARLPF